MHETLPRYIYPKVFLVIQRKYKRDASDVY